MIPVVTNIILIQKSGKQPPGYIVEIYDPDTDRIKQSFVPDNEKAPSISVSVHIVPLQLQERGAVQLHPCMQIGYLKPWDRDNSKEGYCECHHSYVCHNSYDCHMRPPKNPIQYHLGPADDRKIRSAVCCERKTSAQNADAEHIQVQLRQICPELDDAKYAQEGALKLRSVRIRLMQKFMQASMLFRALLKIIFSREVSLTFCGSWIFEQKDKNPDRDQKTNPNALVFTLHDRIKKTVHLMLLLCGVPEQINILRDMAISVGLEYQHLVDFIDKLVRRVFLENAEMQTQEMLQQHLAEYRQSVETRADEQKRAGN